MKKKLLTLLLCASVSMTAAAPSVMAKTLESQPVTTDNASEISGMQAVSRAAGDGETIELKVRKNSDIAKTVNDAIADVADEGSSKVTTIVIPAGNYRLSAPVKLVANNLRLVATNATIVGTSSGMYSMLRTNNVKVKNVTVEGGIWDANKKAGYGVLLYDATNATIKNCTVKNGTNHGLRTQNSTIALENTTFTASGKSGIYADAKTNFTKLSKCSITSNAATGITLNGAKIKNISGTSISYNKDHGIALRKGSQIGSMTKCIVKSNKSHGIYVMDNSTAEIGAKTRVQNNKENGICVSQKKSKAVLTGVTVNNNQANGIVFSRCGGGKVVDTTVSHNGGHGMTISDSVVNMLCTKKTGNVVEYNDWSGVSITGKSSKVTIKYGSYSHNGLKPKSSSEGESGHGVGVFSGATLEVSNATIQKNSVCGISPFGNGTTAVVKNCTVTNNGRHGVGGRKGVTLKVKGNTIKNNKYHGIMVNDHTNAKYIEKNKISGNKKCGISLGDSSKAVIKGNTISGSKEIGIYVYGSSTGDISSNTINDNKKGGVDIAAGASITLKKNAFSNPGVMEFKNEANANIGSLWGITISSAKKNAKKITGTAAAGSKVSVKISGKTYSTTAGGNGAYTIKTPKLKKGTKIKVQYSAGGSNSVYISKTI